MQSTALKRNFWILFPLIMVVLLLLVVVQRICGPDEHEPAKPTRIPVGEPAPHFAATTLEGRKISLEDFKGKVTAIVFWATWCGPCKPLNKCLGELYEKFHLDGFDVVAFSADEELDKLESFLTKVKYPWRHNVWLGDWENPIARKYGVAALPTFYLLSRDGKIRASELAMVPEDGGLLMGPTPDEIVKSLLLSEGHEQVPQSGGWVGGVVVRNGVFVQRISPKLIQIDGDNPGIAGRIVSSEEGSYSFHNVRPGRWLLEVSMGRMSGPSGNHLALSREINVLEDIQWHNFRLKDGTCTIKCPLNGTYVLAIRRWDPELQAWMIYSQVRDIWFPDGKHQARREYSFAGLQPGQYEYRLSQQRHGSDVYVAGGKIAARAGQTVMLKAKPPSGPCTVSGRIENHRKDISGPVVFVREASAEPITYSRYYEMGTWDTVVLLRRRDMAATGRFECKNLPAGEYTVTVAQLQDSQYGIPLLQQSKRVSLSKENPHVSLDFDLASRTK